MKVSELIKELKKLPQDKEVGLLYDGEVRLNAGVVYESNGGKIVIADCNEVVYSDLSRPIGAPSAKDRSYWYTPPEQLKENA
ncbi:MAG TPA: hypothetical protein VD907_06580 [Verrucomicrobiae bacterium]|nr:hypothetical protein [Verrucomicrobiae bacterium]